MALTFNGVQVKIINSMIPTGYTKTPVTTFDDEEYITVQKEVTIAKSTVENTNKVTAFTALVAAINTNLTTLIGTDFDTTQTVTAYADFNYVSLNSCGTAEGSEFYTDTAPSYVCGVLVYIKTAA